MPELVRRYRARPRHPGRRWALVRAIALSANLLWCAAPSPAATAPPPPAQASAVATPPPARSLRFEHLGLEQSLSQESVLNILQDRQGFMWFGTQAGLSRYDGYKMTVFKNDSADPSSIPDNYVSASFEDAAGRLWFGTKGGLAHFDRATQSFVRYGGASATGGGSNRTINAIVADGPQALWLATGEGLLRLDVASGKFESLRHDPANPASLGDDKIVALARAPDGALWVGTGRGLSRLVPGTRRFERFMPAPDDALRNNILSLSSAPDGSLWIGTARGLEVWELGQPEPVRRRIGPEQGVEYGRIYSLYHDPLGNLWVGTDPNGLKWRDPVSGEFAAYRHHPMDRHSLSDNVVASACLDRTGTLWIGTWYGGVNRVDIASGGFERFSHLPDEPQGLGSSKIRAMSAAADGRLWLGTTGGGLDLFNPATGRAKHFRHDAANPRSLPGDVLTSVEASGQRVWVGSPSGLAWLDPASGAFTTVPLPGEAAASYVQRTLTDRTGQLWIVTRGGVHRHDPATGNTTSLRHDPRDPDSLGDDYVFAIVEDRQGRIWIGTDSGLDRYDSATGHFRHFRHDPANPAGLRHRRVYFLFESRKGEIWVGTAGGLHKLEEDAGGAVRFRFYSLNGARTADPIGAILEDDAGSMWISTTAGMSRFDPVTGQSKNFTARDGLIDGAYFVGSAARLPDGRLNFGGVGGLTSFHAERIRVNPYPPAVAITDFLIFNRSVQGRRAERASPATPSRTLPFSGAIEDARAITLTHRDSVLSFEFAALHFADPQRNRYAYRLEGFDQGWVYTDANKRFATYTNLDPGHYIFRVKASNKDEVWSTAPASLDITITPPWWRTWWFRCLMVALVLGISYALLRVRIHALLVQRKRLETLVGSRTAELQLQKDSVERQKLDLEHQKDAVEVAHRNISLLSEIGRELTSNLDSESIMLMLYDHVNDLMDASVFGIGVYRPERAMIDYPFAIERGKRYLPYSRSMHEPNQLAVWCITSGREVFINKLEDEYQRYIEHLDFVSSAEDLGTLEDGSLPTAPRSLLYVPISVNGRMLGVVTVHSYRENAYERIHLDMLRTLAAYVGVAFDNAEAYRQLKSTQAQLVAQEKLAALGSLVAGVAHELNTPIGNSLLMASTLQEKTGNMADKFSGTGVRRSELKDFIEASQEAAALIMRSLLSAADLVNSFKQVAVDQASANRRRFNLELATHEIVATMMNQVRKAGHSLEMAVPPGIEMDSFPGPYGQVLINLINNALLHAFEGRGAGEILISASTPLPERVEIRFRDNGVGIPVEHQARIFDPFFTTKMGQGGSGLGLNITYNIVTSLLEGNIRVESSGQGTVFIMDLPLRVTTPPPVKHTD